MTLKSVCTILFAGIMLLFTFVPISADFERPLISRSEKPSFQKTTLEESSSAKQAIQYISKKYNIDPSVLTILADYFTESMLTNRKLQLVTLVDTGPEGDVYKVYVDLNSQEISEDFANLEQQEAEAYRIRYGKFQPSLLDKLSKLNEDDSIEVVLWIAAAPNQVISQRDLYT